MTPELKRDKAILEANRAFNHAIDCLWEDDDLRVEIAKIRAKHQAAIDAANAQYESEMRVANLQRRNYTSN
jgi:vacuolar-type H+-ATPase subunit I/STV1